MRTIGIALLACAVGFVLGLAPGVRAGIRALVHPIVPADIEGSHDYELVFGIVRTHSEAVKLRSTAAKYGFKNIQFEREGSSTEVAIDHYPTKAAVDDALRELNRVPKLKPLHAWVEQS